MLIIQALKYFPQIEVGDDIGAIILQSLIHNDIRLQDGDILVVTQKIVSKAEGQYIALDKIVPGPEAVELGEFSGKDPHLVQVILNESNEIVRKRPGVIIAEHRLGFVCANAGVDHSNLPLDPNSDKVLALPQDPDNSAQKINEYLKREFGFDLGILIIDSHGRAWRNGTVGISIGTSNVPELVSKIGDTDMFGRELKATVIAAADQLAAAAALEMGEADEGTPVVHVRGFPYPLNIDTRLSDVLRSKEKDLFR